VTIRTKVLLCPNLSYNKTHTFNLHQTGRLCVALPTAGTGHCHVDQLAEKQTGSMSLEHFSAFIISSPLLMINYLYKFIIDYAVIKYRINLTLFCEVDQWFEIISHMERVRGTGRQGALTYTESHPLPPFSFSLPATSARFPWEPWRLMLSGGYLTLFRGCGGGGGGGGNETSRKKSRQVNKVARIAL